MCGCVAVRKDRIVKDAIAKIEAEYASYGSHHDASKAMYESGLWDGGDLPSCDGYTYRFLWCLHAIKWFCAKLNLLETTDGKETTRTV